MRPHLLFEEGGERPPWGDSFQAQAAEKEVPGAVHYFAHVACGDTSGWRTAWRSAVTLCVKTGYQCVCQPEDGVFCPDYKPDAYVQCLMNAIKELIEGRTAPEAANECICPKCGIRHGGAVADGVF